MKNIKNILFLLSLFSILLSSCNMAHLKEVSPRYTFPTKYSEAIGVTSFRCNIGEGKTDIHIYSPRDGKTYALSFDCHATSEPLTPSQLKIFKLAPGSYVVQNWHQYEDLHYFVLEKTGTTFYPILWNLKPNQVNYLGQLQLIAGKEHQYRVKIINNAEYDISEIKSKLPLLSSEKITINLSKISNRLPKMPRG